MYAILKNFMFIFIQLKVETALAIPQKNVKLPQVPQFQAFDRNGGIPTAHELPLPSHSAHLPPFSNCRMGPASAPLPTTSSFIFSNQEQLPVKKSIGK